MDTRGEKRTVQDNDPPTTKRSNIQNTEFQNYDVVISGMGPAGLGAALKAAKTKDKVLIFTHLPKGFIRVNSVFLSTSTKQDLWDMFPMRRINNELLILQSVKIETEENTKLKIAELEKDRYFLNLIRTRLPIPIKLIEQFLMRRVEEINQERKVEFLYNVELSTIDLYNGTAELKHVMTNEINQINFDYIVGADGARRHALSVLEKHEKTMDIKVQRVITDSESTLTNIGMYITIERVDKQPLKLPIVNGVCAPQDDEIHYIDFRDNKINNTVVKCYSISIIPDHNPSVDEMLQKVKKALTAKFQQLKLDNGELTVSLSHPSRKYGERKDKLKFFKFKAEPHIATEACIVNNNHYFVLLGDAYYNPDFHMGVGMACIFLQLYYFGNLLKKNDSVKEFNNRSKNLLELTKPSEEETKAKDQKPLTTSAKATLFDNNVAELHKTLMEYDFDNPPCIII